MYCEFERPETSMSSTSKLLSALHDALSVPSFNCSSVNDLLDKLMTEICSRNSFSFIGDCDWISAIRICCKKSESPLISAKCANILLVLIGTHQIALSFTDIEFIVTWTCKNLGEAPDIVYLDFLQLINAVMKKEPNYFASKHHDLLDVLILKLEDKATVSIPQDICYWRVTCLKTLSSLIPSPLLHKIAISYFDIASALKNNEKKQWCGQIWIKVLDGLDTLCSLSCEWIHPFLRHMVVSIHSSMTFGLHIISPSPTLQFPAYSVLSFPTEFPLRPVVKLKKKAKGKVKRCPWTDDDNLMNYNDGSYSVTVETTPWLSSSDSELSDSEIDMLKQSKKLEAHVRHSAYNLLIHLTKIVGCKSLFEWYCALFATLIEAVHSETYSKPRCAVFGALTTFLSGSKQFLAQAQHSEGQSFTSFSEVLAGLLTSLHFALIRSLNNDPSSDKQQFTALFLATSSLIKVTPYYRLQQGLFSSLVCAIQCFSVSQDTYIVSCVLQCLLEVVLLTPVTDEISKVIDGSLHQNEFWLLQYALSNLENETNGIRVFAWALISGLCQYHFKLTESHVTTIENRIILAIAGDKPLTPPLKALACLLDKYLSDNKYVDRTNDLWDKMLTPGSPFLHTIQDPGKLAAVACDCLSIIGSRTFYMLSKEKKILVITLVFGCCCSELQIVRFAALNALSNFLAYPQMSEHVQFVSDAKDKLIEALKDSAECVRIKAAWAFSNLIDLLIDSKDNSLMEEINILQLLLAALSLASDTQKVRQNISRAVGHVLLLVSTKHIELPKWKETVLKACEFLHNCATSGSLMKMRWNACHAIAAMLSNESLYDTLSPEIPKLLKSLCRIIVSCNNFKVRMNACLALGALKQRKMYGSFFSFVWQSLLEGLDNAANMPDFSEFKHQHGLLESLCASICHMMCFIESGDLAELEEILIPRFVFLSSHLKQYQERITPEQAGAFLKATNHLETVVNKCPHNGFIRKLSNVFKYY